MRGRHLTLPSPTMGRNVHVWAYGHFGPPVVAFPTAAGFAHEWDSHGMVELLSPWLAAGRFKLYCPESNVAEAWTKKEGSLAWRMERHKAYERFVLDVLLPWINEDCHTSDIPVMAVGCSLGGTYAANFALKFPDRFRNGALCMSGRYLATALTKGEDNADVFFNNPLAYVPGISGAPLQRIRENTHLTMVCGRGKWEEGCIEETIALCDWFDRKQIPHTRDIWGLDSVHDWDWWKKQTMHHLGRKF